MSSSSENRGGRRISSAEVPADAGTGQRSQGGRSEDRTNSPEGRWPRSGSPTVIEKSVAFGLDQTSPEVIDAWRRPETPRLAAETANRPTERRGAVTGDAAARGGHGSLGTSVEDLKVSDVNCRMGRPREMTKDVGRWAGIGEGESLGNWTMVSSGGSVRGESVGLSGETGVLFLMDFRRGQGGGGGSHQGSWGSDGGGGGWPREEEGNGEGALGWEEFAVTGMKTGSRRGLV